MTSDAKEVIDNAIFRTIVLLAHNPQKKILYYSANPIQPHQIGLGIFANMVGDDVVSYISKRIHEIPELVSRACKTGIITV